MCTTHFLWFPVIYKLLQRIPIFLFPLSSFCSPMRSKVHSSSIVVARSQQDLNNVFEWIDKTYGLGQVFMRVALEIVAHITFALFNLNGMLVLRNSFTVCANKLQKLPCRSGPTTTWFTFYGKIRPEIKDFGLIRFADLYGFGLFSVSWSNKPVHRCLQLGYLVAKLQQSQASY